MRNNNCFATVLTGHKPKKARVWPFYLMLSITAIAIITQDNLLCILAGIDIFFYVMNKFEGKQ